MILDILLLIMGFVLLIKCSEYMIDSASTLAVKAHIPQFIIGFSVIAFGTSAPELIIGIITGISKTNQITMGDVLGSAIANVALVVGVAAIIKNIHIEAAVIKKEIPLSIVTQALLMLLLFIGGALSKIDGIILLLCFIVFLIYIFTRSKESVYVDEADTPEYNMEETKKDSILRIVLILLLSITGVVFGGNFVVRSSTEIARALGISELMIGLTIVAIGTSLPELVTTIIAVTKNKSDIAIGNVIGSNIFNVLFVLGVSSLINPMKWIAGIQWDFILVLGVSILLLLLSIKKKKLNRINGILLSLYYIGYIVFKIITVK